MRSESAFTLIETVLAAVLMLVVATALAGVLTSSIGAHTTARERTLAKQALNDQIESVRNLTYGDVGIDCSTGSPCNPPGDVDASKSINVNGFAATVTTTISYVGDPTPTSYATAANYKKVTVFVTRDRDDKELARSVTYVAPVSRAPYGGIDKSIVNVQVMDFKLNSPLAGSLVTIKNGPDPTRTDISDISGTASFAAMTPTSGSQYYDLLASLVDYETLPVDLPNAAVAHIQVAPSQTAPTSQIRLYKPGTIQLRLESSPGVLYTAGTATVTVTASTPLSGSSTFTTTNGLLDVTTVGGQDVVPGVAYSIKATTPTPLCATGAAPTFAGYPADTTSTVTLSLTACPSGSLAVNVQQIGLDSAGATVRLTGGPNNITVSPDPVTNTNGDVTFTNIPAGSGYTVQATKAGYTASTTATVTVAGPNSVTVTLPAPPTATLRVTVNQLSDGAAGATVTLSGGPLSITASGTTDSNGLIIFTNVPTGSSYTVTALKVATTVSTATTVATGTNNLTLTLPSPAVGSLRATVTWVSVVQANATVRLYGGPYGIDVTGTPTNTSGQTTFANVPSGTGYSVEVTKNGQTETVTGQTVTTSVQTNTAVALPTGTINVTVTWAGLPVGIVPGAGTVTITGGPLAGTYTGSTNASGVASITVPATSSTYPYTVKAQKTGSALVTAGSTITTLAEGATATSSVALTPTKVFTITVQRGGNTTNGRNLTGLTVSITGGPNGTAGGATIYQFTPVATNNSSVITTTITVPAVSSGTTPAYTIKVWGCALTSATSSLNEIGSATTQSAAATTTTVTVNLNSAASATCPPTP